MVELGTMDGEQKKRNLESFRSRVRNYCRLAGKTQQALAYSLDYPHTFLSHKLNGSGNACLTVADVKGIVKILADWQAINHKSEAIELLQLRNLGCNAFSKEDWATQPLSRLEAGETYN